MLSWSLPPPKVIRALSISIFSGDVALAMGLLSRRSTHSPVSALLQFYNSVHDGERRTDIPQEGTGSVSLSFDLPVDLLE